MRPKVSYMLVGAFVLALGAALVGTIVWLSAAGSDHEYDTYVTYVTESVSGLSTNANVSYNGVEIGRVSDIALDVNDPRRVRVLLDIEQGSPIKTDTVATLASQGITGVAHIELSGGSAESAALVPRPGEEFAEIETRASLFVRLDESITGLVTELTGAATSLNDVADRVEMLLDEDNRDAIGEILANVETFTAGLDGITTQVEQVVANVAAATDELPALMDQAGQTLEAFEASAESLEGAGDGISVTAQELQIAAMSVADSVNGVIDDLQPLTRGGPTRLVQLVDELQLLAGTLRRLSQDVERNPEMLLFGRRDVVRGPGE